MVRSDRSFGIKVSKLESYRYYLRHDVVFVSRHMRRLPLERSLSDLKAELNGSLRI
jgi:hypothetical protein